MEKLTSEPLVSVIVPVYNVEKYLVCCLDSIVAQTYQNLDIILINDGSSDDSEKICRQYEKKDARIRLFVQENKGLSSARNIGLDHIKGKYIVFVDSDDYISPYMIEILLAKVLAYNVPAAVCDSMEVMEDRDSAKLDRIPEQNTDFCKIMTRDDVLKTMGTSRHIKFITVLAKIFERQIFEGLRFAVGKVYEDEFIFHRIYTRVERLCYIDLKLYGYRISLNSITRKDGKRCYYPEDSREMGLERLAFFQEYGNKRYVRAAGKTIFFNYVYCLDRADRQNLRKKVKELEKDMRRITGKPLFWLRFKVLICFPDIYWFLRKYYLWIKKQFT